MAKKLKRSDSPLSPPEYSQGITLAIQALMRGDATENQQQIALKWIIEEAGGMYEEHYYPTDRDTTFSLGRQFVAQAIVKQTKITAQHLDEGD